MSTSEEMAKKLNEYANEFEALRRQRHEQGEKKYGPGTWLKVDTIQHAMDEVLDLGNYAMFTYIKLAMLRDDIVKVIETAGEIGLAKEGYDGPLAQPHFIDGKREI